MCVNALETLTLCLRYALVHGPGIVGKCISKIHIYIFLWKQICMWQASCVAVCDGRSVCMMVQVYV